MRTCIRCNAEIDDNDNFCPKCGNITTNGILYFKIHASIPNKQHNKITILFILISLLIITTSFFYLIKGESILRPLVYINQTISKYKYGYNTTIIKTDNLYTNKKIEDIEGAKSYIDKDLNGQKWECKKEENVSRIEYSLEDDYDIISVNFCEMDYNTVSEINNVIRKMYELFPNIKGYLTNITITNSLNKDDYVLYFQPVYNFVNNNLDINNYNKVNKTQILLNSYYFLNEDKLNNTFKNNWYVNDSSYISLISHEFGHYISFVSYLKYNNIDSIMFQNVGNNDLINNAYDTKEFSKNIVYNAINYNNISEDEFISSISNYASKKDNNGNYIYDEVIAEAIHDYYLHGANANKYSLDIVNIINIYLEA